MTDFLGGIVSVIIALIIFSILVIIHEFGHFIIAKKNGIFVEEFSVGMGPLVLSKKYNETLYSIRLFPLGGFCRMLGEEEEHTDERAFTNKSVLARMAVIVAGPFFNIAFAFIVMICLTLSSGFAQTTITNLDNKYPAAKSGLQVGDEIKKLDNQKILVYEDYQLIMMTASGKEMEVEVERNGEKKTFFITPEISEQTGQYILGFTPLIKNGTFAEDIEGYQKAGFFETIGVSFNKMIFLVKSTIIGFIRLVTLNVSSEEIAGPIGIVDVVGDTFEESIKISIGTAVVNMFSMAALLSANLGVLNLFPIPAMDGGRFVFLVIEGIRRKPINREKEGLINFIGFVLLMAFMVFVAYNDIMRIFTSA